MEYHMWADFFSCCMTCRHGLFPHRIKQEAAIKTTDGYRITAFRSDLFSFGTEAMDYFRTMYDAVSS